MRKFNLVTRKVTDLIPYDRNSRTHSEAQVAQLAASIEEFGFTNPVLIDEQNTVVAGEGRLLAARKLKLDTIPCIELTGLTEAQKAAYVIADNKLALNSGWNADVLFAELDRISGLDIDPSLTGFSEVEILALLNKATVGLADVVPSGAQDHWSGMPEFNQPANGPFRTLLVHFDSPQAVEAFSILIGRRLTDKTKYLWYPEQEKRSASGVVYD